MRWAARRVKAEIDAARPAAVFEAAIRQVVFKRYLTFLLAFQIPNGWLSLFLMNQYRERSWIKDLTLSELFQDE